MDRRQFIEILGAASLVAGAEQAFGAEFMNSAGIMPVANDGKSAIRGLVPIPTSVVGVQRPILNANGTWEFCPLPAEQFWKKDRRDLKWVDVSVPSEFEMLGFEISPDVEYPCRRSINIPREFANRRVFVRFDGVYSYARVWVNEVLVGDHSGGFTSWDVEITDQIQPGASAELMVGITDKSDDISQGSYYAKHSIAGILRDVRVYALPKSHLSSLVLVQSFDNTDHSGCVSLKTTLASTELTSARVRVALMDSSGQTIGIASGSEVGIGTAEPLICDIRVPTVKAWDSEHPNLYRLEVALVAHGQVIETVERNIGFRSVQRVGNQLVVNGQPVKLYGACRHSIHPIYGRALPPEFDEKDVLLFREANINFVRTSHYPPTEAFLDACDRHGMYVEEETAVCWSEASSSKPDLEAQFLKQFQEMVMRDRHHASVLFWSLGNESSWGTNFAAEKRYASEHDPSRPTIFSYPDTVPFEEKGYDIYSKHYPDVHSSLDSATYPLLNDEFGHVSCYNLETLRRDPGVRNFWGESIQRFADSFLEADGCLGGSIWAGIDDVFLLPRGPVGYGQWGVIDGWRRRKPEHWLTRKAYSPIRINEVAPLQLPPADESLQMVVKNAFNHTNLSEVGVEWRVASESGRVTPSDIPPHTAGLIEIPHRDWQHGEQLHVDFRLNGALIEQADLQLGTVPRVESKRINRKISLAGRADRYFVTGAHFALEISKETGLITKAWEGGAPLLEGGPFLDLGSGAITSWLLKSCDVRVIDDRVVITTTGESKLVEGISSIPVRFEISIDGAGLITTHYRAETRSHDPSNLGIAYLLPESFDQLSWKCKAQWSHYPNDHIGRPEGVAMKRSDHPIPAYREEPTGPWSQDMSDYFLWGKAPFDAGATNDFRSLKSNILWASVKSQRSKTGVRTEADADSAVRVSVESKRLCFSIYRYWSYSDLTWGNYVGPGAPPATTTLETKLWLTGQTSESS